MPDDVQDDLLDPEQPAEEAPKPEEPKKDDEVAALRAAMSQLREEHAELRGQYNAVLANLAAGNQDRRDTLPAAPADVSDEEIEAAVAEGDGRKVARLVRKQAEAAVARAVQTLKTETIDPLANAVNGVGIPTLAAHAMEIARPQLKYLKRFEKEIAQALSGLGPAQRANFEAVKAAHDLIVGANMTTIVEEEVEQRARAKAGNPGGGPTPRRAPGEPKVAQPEDLGGQEAVEALNARGGKDRFAMLMGYKDWDDYSTQTAPFQRRRTA